MQQRAALWITGAFCISPTLGVETIADLIPIHLYLQKLSGRHQIWTLALLVNHAINTLLERRHTNNFSLHYLSLENITEKQRLRIKSSVVDANNHQIIISIEFFHLSILLIVNFLYVSDWLTIFLVTFLFIKQTIKTMKAKLLIFVNLTKFSLMHHQIPC